MMERLQFFKQFFSCHLSSSYSFLHSIIIFNFVQETKILFKELKKELKIFEFLSWSLTIILTKDG